MRESVYVVFDIETVAEDKAQAYYAQKSYEAPINYKDPVKIEAVIREKRQADMEKAALHWWTGKVVCICANVLNAEEAPRSFCGADEKKILTDFMDWLCYIDRRNGRPVLTGKSSEYFDIPFLVGRILAHDLGVHESMRPRYPITDVDKIFSTSTQCDQRSNLANYAWGLKVDGKTAKGSDVASMWIDILQKKPDAEASLIAYCARDNEIATTMLRRWLKEYIPVDPVVLEDATTEESDIPF